VVPRVEGELGSAASNGLLVESHHRDLKRELAKGGSANKRLTKDIAAFITAHG
jgi:hypothetical protein